MKNLNCIKNAAVFVSCVFAVFLCTNLQADAAYYVSNCNSPCENPCAPSRTICEGNHCTTYCNASHVYNLSRNYTPGVTFSYSTPNVSFSISNEYIGYDVLKINRPPRPIVRYRYHTGHPAAYYTGRPAVHHVSHKPQRPIYDRPVVKPKPAVHNTGHRPQNSKPAHNIKPAPGPKR